MKISLSALGTNREKYSLRLNPPPALLRNQFFVEGGNNLNLGCYIGIKYLMRSFASVTFESSTLRPIFPLTRQRAFTKILCVCSQKYVRDRVTARLHTDFCATTQKSVWDSLRLCENKRNV